MFDPFEDSALRDALRAVLVPTVSVDFDSRVLAALAKPAPRWVGLRRALVPLLSGAACSLLLMLALLHWTMGRPSSRTQNSGSELSESAIDAALDQPNLSIGSLARLSAPKPSPAAASPQDLLKHLKDPAPSRHPGQTSLPAATNGTVAS